MMPEIALKSGINKVRPGQPSQLWSFANANSLLEDTFDQNVSDSLDEFLMLHRDVITNPNPLALTSSGKQILGEPTEISLHGILYTNITKLNVSDAKLLSNLLHIDPHECLRIICQVCKKFPERRILDFENFNTRKQQQHSKENGLKFDDRDNTDEERLLLYASKILRERRNVLDCDLTLLSKKLDSSCSATVQNLGKDLFLSPTFYSGLIDTIKSRIHYLSDQAYKTGYSDKMDILLYKETSLYIVGLLKILIELSINNSNLSALIVLNWFQFMHSTNFMGELSPVFNRLDTYSNHDNQTECLLLINGLSTMISVALLDLDNNFGADDEPSESFMNNPQVFKELNHIISNPDNKNAVVMYAWSILLLRKSYIISEDPSATAIEFGKTFNVSDMQNAISYLTLKCNQLDVFHEIAIINETFKFDNLYPALLSSIIQAAMPLVTLTPEIASTISEVLKNCPSFIIEKVFDNEAFINAFIVARAKFPYQISLFVKLASINGNFAFSELKELKSYMCQYPKSEFNSMSAIDDENTELVKINRLVDIFPPYELNNKLSLLLTPGTKAKTLPCNSESDILVTFIYRYSGLAFLGRVLQNLSTVFDPLDKDKLDITIDILRLLTQMIKDNSHDDGVYIIQTMSAYIDGSDLVEVILRLLEQGLHTRNVKVSKTIFDLLYYVDPLVSDRVWNYLSNSILLSDGGKEGFITTIFSSIEMITGDYDFTISFIKLTETLAHDCLELKPKIPVQTKSKVLAQCINHLILIFETFSHCSFNKSSDKLEMGALILDTFTNILSMVYGLQNSLVNSKISEVFVESARSILDSFLINNSDFARTTYPLNSLIDSLHDYLVDYELKDITSSLHVTWISNVLKFSELIVLIRTSINYPPSTFETMLFSRLPTLVKCYANYEILRKDILNLMTALTNGAWPHEIHPSLLSHLGRNNTQILLNSIITDLENDFEHYNIKVAIYDFISAVMSGDQEGLSVLLLGVRDIVDNLTKDDHNKNDAAADNSLIKILRNNVKNIEYLPDSVALHLVDSMVLVMNSWSSINSGASGSDSEELEYITQLINKANSTVNENLKTVDDYIATCYRLKLISKINEVLALYLFSTKSEKIKTKISGFLNSSEFRAKMKQYFVMRSYHNQLHNDLESDFKAEYPNFKLSDFRCSLIKRNRYGITTVYNLLVMDGMFAANPKYPQIREKIIASAVELQYMSAQVDVSKSLGALLTALCRKSPGSLSLDFIDFCTHLLRTNIEEGGIKSEFFKDIYSARIQLAFFMVYAMYNCRDTNKDTKLTFELLKASSELLSSNSMNFIANLIDSTGNYRPLLRIIYCCLSAMKNETELLVEYFSIFRQLFDFIINRGTKVVLIEIQNDVYLSKTTKGHESTKMSERIDDILLILSILKLFVEIRVSPNSQFEMAKIIEDNGLIRSLLNLYSFSHLIEIEGDYVFAQVSLMFIQELMKIDIIAKKFIEHGLFTVLQGSSISKPIKNGDINIITSPRFHRIWTNGILPIILFTLNNVGPDVLPDTCFVLGNFRKQIESCIDSWSKDSSAIRITTATINETSQLLLLLQLLKKFNVESYFGINKFSLMANTTIDVPVLPGIDSVAKREDFIDYINNLLKHPKFLSSRISPSSIEEQRIIELGGQPFEVFVKNLIEEISALRDYI